MRIERKKSDFWADSRRSISKDWKRYGRREKVPQIENSPQIGMEMRVAFVGERSDYYRHRSCVLGKKVRLVCKSDIMDGWICEFVHDDDRKALNKAGGWSDNKRQYLFNYIKFKQV